MVFEPYNRTPDTDRCIELFKKAGYINNTNPDFTIAMHILLYEVVCFAGCQCNCNRDDLYNVSALDSLVALAAIDSDDLPSDYKTLNDSDSVIRCLPCTCAQLCEEASLNNIILVDRITKLVGSSVRAKVHGRPKGRPYRIADLLMYLKDNAPEKERELPPLSCYCTRCHISLIVDIVEAELECKKVGPICLRQG